MQVLAHAVLTLNATLEREAVEAVATPIAALLAPHTPPGAARDRIGLFVASRNAGAPTSLAFWAQAQKTGLALASPELFPWCLANAPCGALSRQLGITGPNFSFLGDAGALFDALETAHDLLHAGRIELGLVVVLNFADAVRADARGLALVVAPGNGTARTVLNGLPTGTRDWS